MATAATAVASYRPALQPAVAGSGQPSDLEHRLARIRRKRMGTT